ncbi:MAG: hypothetical protein AABX05_03030 [Nanoarchaeota archaeon]
MALDNLKIIPLAVALLSGCSSSADKPSVDSVNCDSIDFTDKAGFLTSFTENGYRYCYGISEESELFMACDRNYLPVKNEMMILRRFKEPEKGMVQIDYVIWDQTHTYADPVTLRKTPAGKITYEPAKNFRDNVDEILFDYAEDQLDSARNRPGVCKLLLYHHVKGPAI